MSHAYQRTWWVFERYLAAAMTPGSAVEEEGEEEPYSLAKVYLNL